MSAVPAPWLPPAAVDHGALRSAAEGVVAAWAGKWFARARPGAERFRDGPAAAAPDGEWRETGGVRLARGPGHPLRIAGLALDAAPERLVLSEADRDILNNLAERILEDLAGRLARAFPAAEGAPAVPAQATGLSFCVGAAGEPPLVRVMLPLDRLVPQRKAACAPRRACASEPVPAADAAGAAPVRIAARLGFGRIALSDLARLSPGDVVLLDRRVDDGADLVLPGCARAFARGSLSRAGAQLALILDTKEA